MKRALDLAAPALVLLIMLAGWELAVRQETLSNLLDLEPFLIPAPTDIAESLWQDRSLLAENAWVTVREVVGGFAVALLLGIGFATILHLSPVLRRAFYPLVVASQTIPVIVVAPIFVVWFGFGIGPILAVIALICFFPITVNTLDGLGTVDPEQRKLMRTLGARRLQTFARLEVPTALPYLLSGAKIAVAIAVIGAVFGEWSGSDSGLGHLILVDNAQLQIPRMFAAIAVLSTIAIAMFTLLGFAERRLAWWGEPRSGRRDSIASNNQEDH
jgi:NitT/TauT family transport system permease protein/putative hydroxymethylpyrimidine transport system permease protein